MPRLYERPARTSNCASWAASRQRVGRRSAALILTFHDRHWPEDRSSNDFPASPRRREVPESVHGDHGCPAPPAHIIDVARFDPQLPRAAAAELPLYLKGQAEVPLALDTDDFPMAPPLATPGPSVQRPWFSVGLGTELARTPAPRFISTHKSPVQG